MDERLKQYLSLNPAERAEFLKKLSPADQGELLKTVLAQLSPTGGGPADPSTTLPATRADRGDITNLPATRADRGGTTLPASTSGLTEEQTAILQRARIEAIAEGVAQQRIQAAPKPPVLITGGKIPVDPNEAPLRKKTFEEFGIPDPLAELYEPNTNDPLRGRRLDGMAARNVSAKREAERRQGTRDQSQLPIGDNIESGKTGRDIFQDPKGRIEGPKQLKERLIREGVSQNDASIAAGQRYNDMFSPKPGTFGYTGPSAQTEAVRNAFEEGRAAYAKGETLPVGQRAGDIATALKEARRANLEAITADRMADPNRKPVGLVTAIESNGQVIAKRGEGDARVINAGTYAGNVESVPGKMELTPAGERMVRDRTTTAQFNREAPLGGVNRMSESISSTAVTGRYGTAVGRQTSLVDELKASGKLPADFKLTDAQKTGQAPLPDALVEARKGVLGEAKTVAEKGTISDPATRIAVGIAGKEGVASIDDQADTADRLAKTRAETARNDAALRAKYSPEQMAALDKTIKIANKEGGEVFDRGDGTFAIRKKKPSIREELASGAPRL